MQKRARPAFQRAPYGPPELETSVAHYRKNARLSSSAHSFGKEAGAGWSCPESRGATAASAIRSARTNEGARVLTSVAAFVGRLDSSLGVASEQVNSSEKSQTR